MTYTREQQRQYMKVYCRQSPTRRHHWILGATHDGTTPGKCKHCGIKRVFRAKGAWFVEEEGKNERREFRMAPSRVRKDQVPFNPHRYDRGRKPWGRGPKAGGSI